MVEAHEMQDPMDHQEIQFGMERHTELPCLSGCSLGAHSHVPEHSIFWARQRPFPLGKGEDVRRPPSTEILGIQPPNSPIAQENHVQFLPREAEFGYDKTHHPPQTVDIHGDFALPVEN